MYKCEIPDCEKMVKIRTTIKNKDSEFFGKRVCPYHASQFNKKSEISDKTKRTRSIRAEIRKDYPDFFKKHIKIASRKRCAETNVKLTGNIYEVCHILSKSLSPEVATDDFNIIYLSAEAHNRFDSSLSNRKEMKCFQLSVERYKELKPFLKKVTHETLFYDKFI
jgi:hypothetical protein